MSTKERIKALEHKLIALGPETHRLKAQKLPYLTNQCRAFSEAGKDLEADALSNEIDALKAVIKGNEQELDGIEKELYTLRARQRRRTLNR